MCYEAAAVIVMKRETFRAKPYICPAGKPTIGYGTTRYPNGVKVTMNDKPCTEVQARFWMNAAFDRIFAELQALVRVPLTHNQWNALISLAYNIGVGVHDGIKGDLADSTLLDCINKRDFAGAAAQFLVWNKAHVNGKLVVLAGLTTRRQEEQALFLQPG